MCLVRLWGTESPMTPGHAALVLSPEATSEPRPPRPFVLIVADEDRGAFSVEGPVTDDAPWRAAARQALDRHQRRIVCGSIGPDRDALAAEYRTDTDSPASRPAAS